MERANGHPPSTSNDLPENVKEKTSSDYYWNSYAHFGIHEEMLKDEVRTTSYQQAICANRHLFKGKVVLDVGCGTGILCMFAAQAGAKMVIGIDCSDIIVQAKDIIKANHFEDVITLIQGKMEEVVLPVDKVDIIVSEWMGYFLLYETMLPSVLFARDKYLREGGIMMPDKARLILTAIEDSEYKESKIDFWENVYGFDMSCIKHIAMHEPLVDVVEPKMCVMKESVVLSLDIQTVTKSDLTFSVPFQMMAMRDDNVHAFTAHFDITFSHGSRPVWFSTGPHAPYTHWKQTVFYLDRVLRIRKGEVITGTLKCSPNERNERDLDIEFEYELNGELTQFKSSQKYMLR